MRPIPYPTSVFGRFMAKQNFTNWVPLDNKQAYKLKAALDESGETVEKLKRENKSLQGTNFIF